MNETKFTKFPMVVKPSLGTAGLSDVYAILDNAAGTPIMIATDVRDANANLFATAPEMYEECEAALSFLNDDSKSPRRRAAMIRSLTATLAKARGEE